MGNSNEWMLFTILKILCLSLGYLEFRNQIIQSSQLQYLSLQIFTSKNCPMIHRSLHLTATIYICINQKHCRLCAAWKLVPILGKHASYAYKSMHSSVSLLSASRAEYACYCIKSYWNLLMERNVHLQGFSNEALITHKHWSCNCIEVVSANIFSALNLS